MLRSPAWLRDMSIRRKLTLLVTAKVASLGMVIAIAVFGMSVLSSVRAYVGGEGLWAKAQKNAIYSLSKYASSRNEKDYQDYLSQLKVPLGDRKARLELSKPHPDFKISDEGFLQGQNHPEDVRGMALLFHRFHRFRHIKQAIQIWVEADLEMEKLQALGQEFRAAFGPSQPSPARAALLMSRLDAANERLTRLENDFSFTMGEAARWARSFLLWTLILGSLAIGLLSVGTAFLVSRSIASGVGAISNAAQRAAQGDLSVRVEVESQDELGRLAKAFNDMTEGLARIDELKNNFVATVSHELRTPLTLNMAPLESMLAGDYGSLSERQKDALSIMHNNVLRLLQMVNGLLDFSKMEAGKMQVKREPSDLAALANAIVDDFQGALSAKDLSLKRRISGAGQSVEMDRYLFERILFNLMSNAVKFTPPAAVSRSAWSCSRGRWPWRSATRASAFPKARPKIFSRNSARRKPPRRGVSRGPGWAWPWSRNVASYWGEA